MKSRVLSSISERPGLTTPELAGVLNESEENLLKFLISSDNDIAEYANGGWYLRLSVRQSTGAGETLERIRLRLLDLSRRNQLLNYKHPKARSLRVVDELPDQLFDRLVNEEGFIFASLPPVPRKEENVPENIQRYLEGIPDNRRPQKKPWAELHGIDPSWELPALDSGGVRHKDLKIQTLLFPDELETRVKFISRLARTAIEESGANVLYLAFGFLSWRESEDSEIENLAPLILLPVKLTKAGRDPRTRRQQFDLRYSEEDMQSNLSLREKLSMDFGLDLPELDDDDTPEKYFLRCEPILKAQSSWSIHRYVSLGFFQFGKLLMYLDLDRTRWPHGKKIDEHSTIEKILEGKISGEASYAEEYDIDDLSFDLPEAHLIEEADSSQHSAIIDAANSKNLVIEGPPGTGKSQTITNIIAVALAQGKSILFVAEKLAALEVVRHRLEVAGLGDFCLELHSHKTQKRKFLEDVGKRLELDSKAPSKSEIDALVDQYQSLRNSISTYLNYVNATVPGFDFCVRELFCEVSWLREQSRWLITDKNELSGLANLPTKKSLDLSEARLGVPLATRRALLDKWEELSNHPLYGLIPHVDKKSTKKTQKVLTEWASASQQLKELSDQLDTLLSNQLFSFHGALKTLVKLSSYLSVDVYDQFNIRAIFQSALPINEIESLVATEEDLSAIRTEANLFWQFDGVTPEEIVSVIKPVHKKLWIGKIDLNRRSANQIIGLQSALENLSQELPSVAEGIQKTSAVVGAKFAYGLAGLAAANDTLDLARERPNHALKFRSPSFESFSDISLLDKLVGEKNTICAEQARLSLQFQLEQILDVSKLDAVHTVLKSAGIFSLFSSEWRMASSLYQSMRHKSTWFRTSQRKAIDVEKLISYQHDLKNFERNKEFASALGRDFKGINTAAEEIRDLCIWYEQIRQKLGSNPDQRGDAGRMLMRCADENLNQLDEISKSSFPNSIKYVEDAVGRINAVEGELSAHIFSDGWSKCVEKCADVTDQVCLCAPVLYKNVKNQESCLNDCYRKLSRLIKTLNSAERRALHEQLLRDFSDKRPWSVQQIDNAKALLKVATALAAEPDRTTYSSTLATIGGEGDELRAVLNLAYQSVGHYQEARKLVESRFAINEEQFFSCPQNDSSCESIYERISTAAKESTRVAGQWHDLGRGVDELCNVESVFGILRHAFFSDGVKENQFKQIIKYIILSELARSLAEKTPLLRDFASSTHDQVLQQFRDADESLKVLSRRRIVASALKNAVPQGISGSRVGSLTEMCLLRHELGKQKRHLPIRKMVRRAGQALQALKPCFMMGPLSVAQYLNPGEIDFDIVVMDEASQMRPEDALGAIARGSQLIVVGDPKQLPPTSFFEQLASDDDIDEDEEATFGTQESILDVVTPIFNPVRTLKWHYRSRHESLIAFSNFSFYNKKLLLFPTAHAKAERLGVKYVRVSGVYSNRSNEIEAQQVVRAVVNEIRTGRGRSIGIAAVNAPQAQVIIDTWDRAVRELPDVQEMLNDQTRELEPMFIKNLENVQGDERDVIFISLTYGKDGQGNFYQRFGPINRDNGWRRLNVLFTRAKEQMVVFSSMDSSMIAPGPQARRGVTALKDFLIYCETGVVPEAAIVSGRGPDSPFEEDVATAVRQFGLKAVFQVGVTGFFIDIGVVDPREPDQYLLGIECDGATYHTAKSARDRDKIRQQVLENLGWKIHRIWSTDWFKNEQTERRKLRDVLTQAEAEANSRFEHRGIVKKDDEKIDLESPAVIRAQEPIDLESPAVIRGQEPMDLRPPMPEERQVSNGKELESRLLELRVSLNEEFPDVEPEHSLLSDTMIKGLLAVKPTSSEEFLQKVPESVRSSIDPDQARIYLSTILMMIEDYS